MSLEELVAAINARKAGVYHFTDTRNLPSIREHGLLSMAEVARRRIDAVPGGNRWSMDADKASGMDEYVHLCFMKDHPMVYYAQKEQRVDSVRYLRISPEVMRPRCVDRGSSVEQERGPAATGPRDDLEDRLESALRSHGLERPSHPSTIKNRKSVRALGAQVHRYGLYKEFIEWPAARSFCQSWIHRISFTNGT